MIVDELASVDIDFFVKVLVPILGQRKTSLIGLSSPEGSDNFFSQLLQLRDKQDNKLLFDSCNIELICEECKKFNLENLNDMKQCVHLRHLIPPWKSEERINRLAALYDGISHVQLNENYGIIADSSSPCYKREQLKTFIETGINYTIRHPPAGIFIGIDPSGGGASELSVVAIAIFNTKERVVSNMFVDNLFHPISYIIDIIS